MEKKVIQADKSFFQRQIFSIFIALSLLLFSNSGLNAKESVLIIRAPGKEFGNVAEQISHALKEEFTFHEMRTDKSLKKDYVSSKISEISPDILVLMDNEAIKLVKQYQEEQPDSLPVIPSIACMSVFLEKEIKGLKNATGITYEVPIVTSLVNLRFILTGPIQKVGIIHRELIGDFILKNIEPCKSEKIELITYSIPDECIDFKNEIAMGLKILIETQNVDAIWIPNDPVLLHPEIIDNVWKPVLRKHKIPSVVCVKGLLERSLGTLAVLPDLTDLGGRIAEMILTIKKNAWQVDTMAIEEPTSVDKLININQARIYFGIKEENLKNYYEVSKVTTIKDEALPVEGTEKLSLRQLLQLAPSSGSFLDLNLSKSPLSMTIIDRDMIKLSGARHISELLEIYVPGFQYMYNKWNGTNWGLRGITNDRNTKFIYLVNGHSLNMQSRDGFMAELTLGMLNDIERIEVLRGPAGFTYGPNAIAGIINVVTRKPYANTKEISYSNGSYNGNEIDSYFAHMLPNKHRIALSFGWRKSDGLERYASILYGKHSWPYPKDLSSNALIKDGVPSDGNFGSTPGNYKVSLDWTWRNLRLYSRITHQVETAGGWFIYDPWPGVYGEPNRGKAIHQIMDINTTSDSIGGPLDNNPNTFWVFKKNNTGNPDTLGWTTDLKTYSEKELTIIDRDPDSKVNGKIITPDDPFWRKVESGRVNRQQYVNNNGMVSLKYKKVFDENELRGKLEFDKAENRIGTEKRPGYDYETFTKIPSYVDVEETFGEQRLTASALYLLKSIPKFQSAFGYEFRWDGIGKDWSGKNEKHEQANWKVVSEVDYFTSSLFGEGFYEPKKWIGFHCGGRLDFNKKANLGNLKLASVFMPHKEHSFKILLQGSSQIGSADFYEYNRHHYDIDGNLRTGWSFENPYVRPDSIEPDLIYVPTKEELKSLKPERIYAFELASTHFLFENLTLLPSFTMGLVKEQQKWVQETFRVDNCGEYKFLNIDLDMKYCNDIFTAGLNHTFQRPFVDSKSQERKYKRPKYEGYKYDSTEQIYIPIMSVIDSTSYTINMITDAITYDGKNFLNLSSHLTKIYTAYTPWKWLTLSANLRIFWGLPGRKQLYAEDKDFVYWDIDSKPMFKLNAGLHFNLPGKMEISFLAYNLLGIDKGLGHTDDNPLVRNTLRWQQMAENDQRGISSNDQMSFSIRIKKEF